LSRTILGYKVYTYLSIKKLVAKYFPTFFLLSGFTLLNFLIKIFLVVGGKAFLSSSIQSSFSLIVDRCNKVSLGSTLIHE